VEDWGGREKNYQRESLPQVLIIVGGQFSYVNCKGLTLILERGENWMTLAYRSALALAKRKRNLGRGNIRNKPNCLQEPWGHFSDGKGGEERGSGVPRIKIEKGKRGKQGGALPLGGES